MPTSSAPPPPPPPRALPDMRSSTQMGMETMEQTGLSPAQSAFLRSFADADKGRTVVPEVAQVATVAAPVDVDEASQTLAPRRYTIPGGKVQATVINRPDRSGGGNSISWK